MAASRIPKPRLRGFLTQQLKKDGFFAFIVSATSVFAWKSFVCDPRKEKYADFYDEYDAKATYEEMKKAGIFTCVNEDGEGDSSNW